MRNEIRNKPKMARVRDNRVWCSFASPPPSSVMVSVSVLLLMVAQLAPPVSPYSMGAPQAACSGGVPGHGPAAQPLPAPYRVSVDAETVESVPGKTVSVRLSAGPEDPAFIGFIIQAQNGTSGVAAGKFVENPSKNDQQLLHCGQNEIAVTHKNKQRKKEVNVIWEPTPDSSGDVKFRATFVRSYDTFWVGVESQKVAVKRAAPASTETPGRADEKVVSSVPEPAAEPEPEPSPEPELTTTAPFPRKEGGRDPNLKVPPGLDASSGSRPVPAKSGGRGIGNKPANSGFIDSNDTAVYDGCGTSKGCFGVPERCTDEKNCQLFVTYALSPNGNTYHFELLGVFSKSLPDSYVAVAFSSDDFMGNDAVVACMKHGDTVKLARGYNLANEKANEMSTEQPTGVSEFHGAVKDLTLSCSFDLEPDFTSGNKDSPVQFNIAKEKYHLLLAAGAVRDQNQLEYHFGEKGKTKESASLTANLVAKADDMLFVRLHGAFMFGAWIGTASLGMLFARYYKTTWTNTQCLKKDMWFRLHQTFMVTTWGLTMAGFVLIFLEVGGWSAAKNPHPILGCVTTGLCFLQPIGALFRCAPDAKRRPIFNWLHWFGGNAAQIVGIVAMFFAVDLPRARLPNESWWILVAFVAFHGLVHFILSIAQCISENRHRDGRADVYPMKDMGVGQSYYYPQTKQDAPGGGLRKFMLGLYFVVNVLFTAVLILMVIFAPIQQTLEKWKLNIF